MRSGSHDLRRGLSLLAALLFFCVCAPAHGADLPEQRQNEIAAWDAYTMALVSGGNRGYDLLVWSAVIGGPAARVAAIQLLGIAPTGEELEQVLAMLEERNVQGEHRLSVLALDLAAAGGGSPRCPRIWKALAEAGEKDGVQRGELWKLWTCGLACCAYGYPIPALFERLPKLLKDENAPLAFRMEMASRAYEACEKAILFRQLAGESADAEQRALAAARTFLAEHLDEFSDGIGVLYDHGCVELLRGICRDPRHKPALRGGIAGLIGEPKVLDEPVVASAFPAEIIRRMRTSALIRSGRFPEAEALLKEEKNPVVRIACTLTIANLRKDFRGAIAFLKQNRDSMSWEMYRNSMLQFVQRTGDRAAFVALQAEDEKLRQAAGKELSPMDFNNFFYTGMELGAYDGKLTPQLLEQLEALPRSAETLDTYGWALYRAGKFDSAETVIVQALRYGKMEHLAVILEHAGDIAAARKDWTAAERRYRLARLYDRAEVSELSPQCAQKQANALQKSQGPSKEKNGK